jgi:hypothetical protein
MDAIIKTRYAELDLTLNRIKAFLQGEEDAEITISIHTKRKNDEFYKNLDQSIADIENGHKVVSFSMEDFINGCITNLQGIKIPNYHVCHSYGIS